MLPFLLSGSHAQRAKEQADRKFSACAQWRGHHGNDVVMRIPDGEIVESAISLSPAEAEHYTIIVGKGAQAKIRERGEGVFTVDLLLEENSGLTYLSLSSANVVRRFAFLENDARLLWIDVAVGGAHSTVATYLAGQGADARFRSVFLGRGDEQYEVRTSMIHAGDRSTSNMLTRSVMLGRSAGTYEGLIRIEEHARGCDAYQKEDTLLLSPDARMRATPKLEIGNEEVRCSHGVSLGQVDAEKIFYMASRGIARGDAISLIIEGFFDEVLGDDGASLRAPLLERFPGVRDA
jgi:Fe-S cluster assembly protein SufD